MSLCLLSISNYEPVWQSHLAYLRRLFSSPRLLRCRTGVLSHYHWNSLRHSMFQDCIFCFISLRKRRCFHAGQQRLLVSPFQYHLDCQWWFIHCTHSYRVWSSSFYYYHRNPIWKETFWVSRLILGALWKKGYLQLIKPYFFRLSIDTTLSYEENTEYRFGSHCPPMHWSSLATLLSSSRLWIGLWIKRVVSI